MTDFQPLVQDRSLSARIAEQIVARIESGEFPVGTKLPAEAELARQFGVSRPSVREALGALHFVGYTGSARGSGSRVVSVTPTIDQPDPIADEAVPNEVLQLFEARLYIEPQVAAIAARDPDLHKLDDAEALIDGMDLVVNEPTLHGETDLRVHRALAEICQNVFLRSGALTLLDRVASPRLRATRNQAWADRVLPPVWGGQHRAIVRAIRAQDVATATEATWEHLASSALNALSVVSGDLSVERRAIEEIEWLLEQGPPGPGRPDSYQPHRYGGRPHAYDIER